MNKARIVCALLLVVVGTGGAKGQTNLPMPKENYKILGRVTFPIVDSGTGAWVDWGSSTRKVRVLRGSGMPGVGADEQVLTCSFDVSWVTGTCDASQRVGALYVAGVYDNGSSVIEKWAFNYSPIGGGNGGLAGEPAVSRTVLFLGASIGKVLSLAADPSERFLLLLTTAPCAVYKLNLTGVGSPQKILDSVDSPDLVDAKFVKFRIHKSEGPKYVLRNFVPWRLSQFWSSGVPEKTLLLSDPEDDGSFVVDVYSEAQWIAAGYDQASNWDVVCE